MGRHVNPRKKKDKSAYHKKKAADKIKRQRDFVEKFNKEMGK